MTTNTSNIHQLPAGILAGDLSTEIFADIPSRKVHFLSNGISKPFVNLPHLLKVQIEKWLLKDKQAQKDLSGKTWSEALEEYAFCLFGCADNQPDFCAEGHIQKIDNFRCSDNCRCLSWKNKNISYKEHHLTIRELQVLDGLKTGDPDKLIAHNLGIALPTLNSHKSNIMIKMDATSKTDVIVKSAIQKILR